MRIIDPDFHGKSRAQREEEPWRRFEHLPEEIVAQISMLLHLTPVEAKQSLASLEFDDPIPSKL